MIPPEQLRLQILQDFAEAQWAWQRDAFGAARLRFAARLAEQREAWEETRRVTLATSKQHRQHRKETMAKYESKRWQSTRADPAKRAAHNARRMASYYRSKLA
jgi:hypothetical protein